MNFKWAIGAAFAVLAATLVLPSVASAHDGSLRGDPSCRDAEGSWTVTWTVETNIVPEENYIIGITVDVNDGGVADDLHLDDFDPSLQDSGTTSGSATTTYGPSDDPKSTEFGANGVNEFTGNIESIEWDDGWDPGGTNYGVSNIITQPDYCVETACVDGSIADQPVNVASTNDCDPVRLCVDGESITVTEFTAESLDGEEGSCVPSEEPPPPPPTVTEEEPEEPVEEEAVAEVSPVVEEVAALPAAGYGTTADSGIAWIAILGLALIGIGGGATVLVNRRG